MSTCLHSRASSVLLTIVGTALSGTIAAFIVTMIYLTSFQFASAGTASSNEAETSARLVRPVETDRCRPR